MFVLICMALVIMLFIKCFDKLKHKLNDSPRKQKTMKTVISKILFIVVIFAVGLPITSLHAAMERKFVVEDKKMNLYWWPKLAPPKGWHQDVGQSLNENANALAPDGSTFVNAETVMYANAVYKQDLPESKTLEQFIENDKKLFSEAAIQQSQDILTADGQKIKILTYSPRGVGNWEEIGYGEEKDYYLVFAISSRSSSGLKYYLKDFEQMIKSYKT
jgi:hypothetical protein